MRKKREIVKLGWVDHKQGIDLHIEPKYTKFIRVDPETWATLKNEATKRSLETHIPCSVGWIVRQLVKNYRNTFH